jgi:hypothetical protein
LKKRTKKLSPLGSAAGTAAPRKIATPRVREKVFLLLFLQKKKAFT